jgi:hypothetical protein
MVVFMDLIIIAHQQVGKELLDFALEIQLVKKCL